MSSNSANQTFDINKQLQDMIASIDKMEEVLVSETAKAVENAGDIIVEEQKRIIQSANSEIASEIKRGKLSVTKNKGFVTVNVGYFSDAIKRHFEALLYEFGRPGKKRKGTDKRDRKIGSWLEPVPHIRKGFDLKKNEATQCAIDALDKAIKEFSK